MTEPSEQAKRKACELTNALAPVYAQWGEDNFDSPPLRALALHLDEVDRVARMVDKYAELRGDSYNNAARKDLRSLRLPDPVDPDEELAREVAAEMTPETGQYDLRNYNAALATIKRLRAGGRLTDAK